MKQKPDNSRRAELRRQAEAKLIERKKRTGPLPATESDARRLVHELQVHQIELEMQNEELMESRAQVEAGLRQYTDLYDFAPVGYFTLARDGAIQQVNLSGANLLGVERSKLINRRFGVFVSPKSRLAFTAFLEKVLSGGAEKGTCEVELLKDKTEPFWAHIEGVGDASRGQGEMCRAVVSNITDRKRMEEALRKARDELEVRVKERTLDLVKANEELQIEIASREHAQAARRETEAMFRTLAETTSAAIFITHGFQILYANPAATTITGYASDELRDMPIWAIAHPTYQELLRQYGVANQWLDNLPSRYELKLVTKDGEERWLDITAGSIQFEGQSASIITAFDITERDRVERALQKAKQNLEVRVAERTAELQQANVELQARNEALDAFAHTVAHDLTNPVHLIVAGAETLAEYYTTMTGDQWQQSLEAMARSGRKLATIIRELLLLAELHKAEVETMRLDMASIVAESVNRLAKSIKDSRAEIVLLDAPAWPVALGHGPWVEEVWANYLSNALKYGGLTAAPRIELGADLQADGMVRFWVRDDGPGLTPEAQSRLFMPFTQLNQVRSSGHGLGLSIVQRIIEKLDGQVGVKSQMGEGSTFYFTLPSAR